MIGFFIDITALFKCLSSPFTALGSVGGSLASGYAQKRAVVAAQRQAFLASMPQVVERPPHIPRVKNRTDAPADGA